MLPPNPRLRFPQSRFLLSGVALLLLGVLPAGAAARPDNKPRFKSPADFTRCIDGYEAPIGTCLEALDVLVKANPAQAFAAGKAVRARLNHAAAVPFFAKAFARADKASPDKVRCADADVALALVSGLSLPAKGGTTVADALTIVGKCWAETEASLLKALSESGQSAFLAENLCPRLLERKVANPSCERKPAATVTAVEPKWRDVDPKTMVAEGAAKVFRGAEGRSAALVKLKNDDAYLVRFDGFRGAWNGRVVLHREAPANSGYDYFTSVGGSRWVSIVVRDGVTEVYPSGDKGPFTVVYDAAASKALLGQTILDQFRKQKP